MKTRVLKGIELPLLAVPVHGALPRGVAFDLWQALMRCAVDGEMPEVQALAGVLAAAWARHGLGTLPLAGVDPPATRQLLMRWFPGIDARLDLDWRALARGARDEPRFDEIEDIVALLMDGRSQGLEGGGGSATEARWVAHAVAQASLGNDHLWQDLHLPSRRELSTLMQRWFGPVAARNDRDMKWKKFLYKQLCDRAEISVCRAPSCSVCTDQALCFGPEDVPVAA